METEQNQRALENEVHGAFEVVEKEMQAEVARLKGYLKDRKRLPQLIAFEENQADWERYLRSLGAMAVAAPDGGSISAAVKWQAAESAIRSRLSVLRTVFYELFDSGAAGE